MKEKMELGSPVDGDSLEQFLQLAVQYEDMGYLSHAKRKHLDAISAHPNTQVLCGDAILLTCAANVVVADVERVWGLLFTDGGCADE